MIDGKHPPKKKKKHFLESKLTQVRSSNTFRTAGGVGLLGRAGVDLPKMTFLSPRDGVSVKSPPRNSSNSRFWGLARRPQKEGLVATATSPFQNAGNNLLAAKVGKDRHARAAFVPGDRFGQNMMSIDQGYRRFRCCRRG